VSPEELQAAAHELVQLGTAYLKAVDEDQRRRVEWEQLTPAVQARLEKDNLSRFRYHRLDRDRPVKRKLEPFLRYWVRRYPPQLQSRRRELELGLASLAWQFLWAPVSQRRAVIDAVPRIRRRFNPADKWPAGIDVEADIDPALRATRMSELAKVNALYETFAHGYIKHDSRRGVRPDRIQILQLAHDTVLLKWIAHEAERTRIPADQYGRFVVYHRTSRDTVQAILASGFIEGVRRRRRAKGSSGLRLSNAPRPYVAKGAKGPVLLRIHIDGSVRSFARYRLPAKAVSRKQWKYREWQVPAAMLTGARVEVVDEDAEA
jgi:hypothetical protein